MCKSSLGFVMLAVVALVALGTSRAADDPKYTIKEVMKQAHDMKDGIFNKVKSGKASKDEKDTLVELYTALGQNKPPKGDDKSWKTKTDALLEAAKGVAADDKGAGPKLQKAANCAACHSAHKGK